ncbi:MAG: NepR family anti-sigma factor [Sphingobium sp.]|jgi:hypothetical protein
MTDQELGPINDMNKGDNRETGSFSDQDSTSTSPAAPPKSPPPLTDEDAGLGNALRNIYQQTVDEDIPSEMLDLLKRLD